MGFRINIRSVCFLLCSCKFHRFSIELVKASRLVDVYISDFLCGFGLVGLLLSSC